MTRLGILFVLGVLMTACGPSTQEIYNSQRCNPPPPGFSESDLIGTWVGGRSDNIDTLVIRDDGRYKQIMHISHPAFDSESDWLPWRLEYGASGIPYLHLEGMHLCAYWTEMDCQEAGGGDLIWYDFCKEEWIKMPNEGVLIVLGSPNGFKPPPRAMHLVLLQKYTIGVMSYELKQP